MRVITRAIERLAAAGLVASSLVGWCGLATAQAEPVPEASPDPRLAEARRHFELGVVHFDRAEWQAALVEFQRSRELAPTKGNTKNLAICLRKVGRFDEALDAFQALLRDFQDLPPDDRELARREIAELSASVGTLEVLDAPAGARVSIDGVDRGTAPLAAALRLSAGTHVVRVVKDGSLPFEARVDLAGRDAKVLHVRLAALTQAGRLRVSEKNGRSVVVVVDGAPVGATPWDGALAPGVHGVSLRGDGLGTDPTRVSVELGKTAALELVAVPLNSALVVKVTPEVVELFVDGAPAGRGTFRAEVRSGTHRIEASLAGYEPYADTVTLADGDRRTISISLEPSVTKPRVTLGLEAGVPIGLLWGGDLMDDCTPPCSSSLPLGVFAVGHATYRFLSGIGLGVHAGYLRMKTTLTGRSETVDPTGPSLHHGTADDTLRLGGLMAGAEADAVFGARFPLTLRVAVGALLGTVTDSRTGTFSDGMASYGVSAEQVPRASYLYLGPEIRVGYRVGEHFDASIGAKLLVLAALARPAWDDNEFYNAGETDAGYFPSATLTGSILVAVLPSVAATYSF